jgi:predicted nucleic acid-binding protein
MIAAHAIRRSAVLATLNKRDFQRFEKFNLTLA